MCQWTHKAQLMIKPPHSKLIAMEVDTEEDKLKTLAGDPKMEMGFGMALYNSIAQNR